MYAIYLTHVCDPEVGVLDTDTLVGTAEDLDGALTAGLAEVHATTHGSWSQFIRIINLEG